MIGIIAAASINGVIRNIIATPINKTILFV